MLPSAGKLPSSFLILQRHVNRRPANQPFLLWTRCNGNSSTSGNRIPRDGYYVRYFSDNSGYQKPKRGVGFTTVFALVGVGTAGLVAYAKYDPEFRKQAKEYVPVFDDFVKVVTGEDRPITESFDELISSVTNLYESLLGGNEEKGKIVDPPRLQTIKPPQSKIEAPAFSKKADDDKIRKEEKKIEVQILPVPSPEIPQLSSISREIKVEEKPTPTKVPTSQIKVKDTTTVKVDEKTIPDIVTRNISELEAAMSEAARVSISSYKSAVSAAREYSEDVCKMLDTKIDSVNPEMWANIKSKAKRRDQLVNSAEEAALRAQRTVEKIQAILQDESVKAPPRVKEAAQNKVNRMLVDINLAQREVEKEREQGLITDRYWQMVADARAHFKEEIESLFPNISIDQRKLEISARDLDLFLLLAFRHVVMNQKELAKLQTVGEARIKKALEQRGEGASEALVTARVEQMLEREKAALEEELQRKLLLAQATKEGELKQQLKRQIEVTHDHLQDALEAKEQEVLRRSQRLVDEKVKELKNTYSEEAAKMVGRMKGLEEALGKRIEEERQISQAQVLFSACQSLFRALKCGVPGMHWSKCLRPLAPEINAIQVASSGKDVLVDTVIKSIPSEAKSRGVYPEAALRERFLHLEGVARRLALVGDEGASLPRYFLSYLQSLILFKPLNPIPASELNDDQVDLSKLDNIEILHRARYWVDRGDISMSLRYMNLLTGAPRNISGDWMKEARIFLETQQAANVLMAHAGSVGIQYL